MGDLSFMCYTLLLCSPVINNSTSTDNNQQSGTTTADVDDPLKDPMKEPPAYARHVNKHSSLYRIKHGKNKEILCVYGVWFQYDEKGSWIKNAIKPIFQTLTLTSTLGRPAWTLSGKKIGFCFFFLGGGGNVDHTIIRTLPGTFLFLWFPYWLPCTFFSRPPYAAAMNMHMLRGGFT